MLIIEIALGIVLGVLILRFWPAVVGGSLILGVLALAFLIVVFVWSKIEKVPSEHAAVVVATMVGLGLLYGVPLWLKDNLATRYPKLHALITGHIPFNGVAKLPLRIAVITSLVITLVAVSITSFVASFYFVNTAVQVFGN
ncbi:MAG: hypothetical protein ABI648_09415 [Betaproteobacteria bacterium]|jgi:hypothetical protein